MRLWKDDACTSTELRNTLFSSREKPVLDLIAAVKGLHELTPQQLSKLIRDSGSSVVRHIAEDGSHIQIDVEKFARYLPLHIISVIMAWERDKSTFKYLLCGILLLHAMCDLATRVPKIEQILLDDVKVSEQLIDLVFYLLIVLGAYRQECLQTPNDIVLLHSALVACGLKLLTVIVSPQYQEVAQVLTAYYKVDTFMDASFTAVCINVNVLQAKLSAEHAESSANTSPTDEETLIHLCQQCECSLHFLQSLCQQKLFRERIVRNKELCGSGGVLLLVQAVMNLKLSPLYSASSSYMSSVSRLKSKALSILLYLCETENVNYLDEVASMPGGQNMAKSVALQVVELLKKMYSVNSNQLTASSEIIHLKGQLELNAMRLADVFSDDSNFRSFIMINFTEVLAALFLVPRGEFVSRWCSSDLPLSEDSATLDIPCEFYAHHITSLLIKVIANLHCFVREVCQDEKEDLFLKKFVRFLQKGPNKLSDGLASAIDAGKTKIVSKNLCSLLSHAESLVPRFLNEDDLQLLRLFRSQFESMVVHAASEDHPIQVAPSTGVQSSPIHIEAPQNQDNADINKEESTVMNVAFPEVDRLNVSRISNDQSFDGEMLYGRTEQGKTTVNVREIERDDRTVEASGSDSSPTRGITDRMDGFQLKEGGFEETMEDEKFDSMHSDEKLQRKRKRPMMNDKQIALIEAALVDEPNMHRNLSSLKLWAGKLSLQGAEVTTSRLKNWLNNRKAKLARVAKDVRVAVDGENFNRQGSSGELDLPNSPTVIASIPSSDKGSIATEVTVTDTTTLKACGNNELGMSHVTPCNNAQSGLFPEPGQIVVLAGDKGEEIGKGKVFQVHGMWFGWSLDLISTCVVDIIELSVSRFTTLPYALEVTGSSFDEAEQRLGLMRVLWKKSNIFQLPPR